ncbi:MAG: hypothetical protein NTV38_13885 [Chloroflexi bacterium]|nr:hypothetical protein [Chloroflexota bacterium]
MKFQQSRVIPVVFSVLFAVLVLAGCLSEQDPTRQQIEAINTLRNQLELPKTPLEFVEMTGDANSPSGYLQVALYQDTEGRKYFVDPSTNQVVEMDARSLLSNISPFASFMSEEDIRLKAQKFISAVIPGFDTLRIGWVYEEGVKGDNAFFSWYGEMAAGAFNRPFAQIAIHRSGVLFAYYNTLMLYK